MSTQSEWYTLEHKPCGTVVYVPQGRRAVCPKCEPVSAEWEDIGKGLMDGIYSTLRHRCGTVVNIAQGCVRTCPKCQQTEHAEELKRGLTRGKL